MIGVFVEFAWDGELDADRLTNLAEQSRARFEGMPGLWSKAFTIDRAGRRATNFYIWESAEAARAFFSDQTLAHVAEIYGVMPTLRFVDVCTLVENGGQK